MYITTDTIVHAGAVLAALTALGGMMAAVYKWFARQKQQDEDIREMKEEQCVMNYALLACLDGLKQLGANGNVTRAHNELEKHINKQAHDMG